jgi:glycine hydroxymethyltransferase
MLVDVWMDGKGITGKDAEKALEAAHITVNKNTIPFDQNKPFVASGLRIGTPAVTTRGMKEEEMLEIADLVAEALNNRSDGGVIENMRKKVIDLTSRFPLPI